VGLLPSPVSIRSDTAVVSVLTASSSRRPREGAHETATGGRRGWLLRAPALDRLPALLHYLTPSPGRRGAVLGAALWYAKTVDPTGPGPRCSPQPSGSSTPVAAPCTDAVLAEDLLWMRAIGAHHPEAGSARVVVLYAYGRFSVTGQQLVMLFTDGYSNGAGAQNQPAELFTYGWSRHPQLPQEQVSVGP